MNPKKDKIFLCAWLLYYVNVCFADSRLEVRRYRRMDINGFTVVLEKKFSFDLKFKKNSNRR